MKVNNASFTTLVYSSYCASNCACIFGELNE